MKKTNSMYFKNLDDALAMVKKLCELSLSDDDLYSDIHIYEEETAFIVEWEQVPYDHAHGGTFKHVDEGEKVTLYRTFPDDHGEYFSSEEEVQEALTEWLKKNPGCGWVRTEYDHWVIHHKKIKKFKKFYNKLFANQKTCDIIYCDII